MVKNIKYEKGSIITLYGSYKGTYFVCDQYGDGAYLTREYNPEWNYVDYKMAHLYDIPRKEVPFLLVEIVNALNPYDSNEKDIIDEILFIQDDTN